MATIEEILKERLAKSEAELAELEEKRKLLNWRISEYRELLGQRNQQDKPILQEKTDSQNGQAYARLTSVQAVEAILRRTGHPMRVSDLAKVAVAGGYGGPHADIDKVVPNFSSMLSRALKNSDSPFIRRDRGLIDLKEQAGFDHPALNETN